MCSGSDSLNYYRGQMPYFLHVICGKSATSTGALLDFGIHRSILFTLTIWR